MTSHLSLTRNEIEEQGFQEQEDFKYLQVDPVSPPPVIPEFR